RMLSVLSASCWLAGPTIKTLIVNDLFDTIAAFSQQKQVDHSCTLVEYGSNVTFQNQQGERASQSAERQGHTTCARYLVVVETCMSLASQVVKLTKQLNEQATDRITLQKQLQGLMDPNKTEGSPSRSP
ncbi:synphilin-1-like, partial [Notothenia coriiceps]|uniref:Synphilin-1-like n=1 Tax=Notothenia coriiceps TaxID=8208 RepID=A0A6I9P082_9TELE